MGREQAFQVEGVVIEVLSNGTCWVELSNGHRLRAFAPGKTRVLAATLRAGDKVSLALSPYDLSEGRLLLEKSRI
jgi:translation initiation factor IF-1